MAMNQTATKQSEPAPAKRSTNVVAFMQEVLPPQRKADLYRSFPKHIRTELFERNLVNVLMNNPDLMLFEPQLIFREISKAAALGLYLDPQFGEAYIITAYNYKTKALEPQLRVGYRGMTKLARQSGDVSNVYAHEVRERDYIECDLGADKHLVHKPVLFSDRGDIIGYYAVARFPDATFDFEPMSLDDVYRIRDRSDGYKAFLDKKIKSTPWATDEVEMAKKTVIRRLVKRLPQSPELADAIRIEDSAEHSSLSPSRVALNEPAPPPPDREVRRIASAQTREGPRERTSEPYAEMETQKPEGKPEPKKEKDPNAPDYDALLKELDENFGTAKNMDQLEDIAERHAERWYNKAPPDPRKKAEVIMARHKERLKSKDSQVVADDRAVVPDNADQRQPGDDEPAAPPDDEPAPPSDDDPAGDRVPDHKDWRMEGRRAKEAGVYYNKPPAELREPGRDQDLDHWRDGWTEMHDEMKLAKK